MNCLQLECPAYNGNGKELCLCGNDDWCYQAQCCEKCQELNSFNYSKCMLLNACSRMIVNVSRTVNIMKGVKKMSSFTGVYQSKNYDNLIDTLDNVKKLYTKKHGLTFQSAYIDNSVYAYTLTVSFIK